MPDQFHTAVGLDELVGNVITTFPGHRAKERSADQIVEEAVRFYETQSLEGYTRTYGAFIDDNDNEIAIWLDAAQRIDKEGLRKPTVYLLKKDLPKEQRCGVLNTDKGTLIVVRSLYQVLGDIRENVETGLHSSLSTYKVDFAKSDKKFG